MIQENEYWLRANHVVLSDKVIKAYIHVKNGVILQIIEDSIQNQEKIKNEIPEQNFYDFGDKYISPGIIDTNFYLNYGFDELFYNDINLLTKVAVMGGVTMVLNQPILAKCEQQQQSEVISSLSCNFKNIGGQSVKFDYSQMIQQVQKEVCLDFGQLGLLEPSQQILDQNANSNNNKKSNNNINKNNDIIKNILNNNSESVKSSLKDVNFDENQKKQQGVSGNLNNQNSKNIIENNYDNNNKNNNNSDLLQNLNKFLGVKIYLAPPFQNGVQYFQNQEDMYNQINSLNTEYQKINSNKNSNNKNQQQPLPVFIQPSLQKREKDILITSPMRKQNLKMRLLNVHEYQQYNISVDAVQGETGEELKQTKKEINLGNQIQNQNEICKKNNDEADLSFKKEFLKASFENTDERQTALLAQQELKNYSNQDDDEDYHQKGLEIPGNLDVVFTDEVLENENKKQQENKQKNNNINKKNQKQQQQQQQLDEVNVIRDRGVTQSSLLQDELGLDQVNQIKNSSYKNNSLYVDQYDKQESDDEDIENEEHVNNQDEEEKYENQDNSSSNSNNNNNGAYLHKSNSGSPIKISKFNNQNNKLKIVPEIDETINNSQFLQKKNQINQIVELSNELEDSQKQSSFKKILDQNSNDSSLKEELQNENNKQNNGLQIKSKFGNKPFILSPVKNKHPNNRLKKLSQSNIQGDVGSQQELIHFSDEDSSPQKEQKQEQKQKQQQQQQEQKYEMGNSNNSQNSKNLQENDQNEDDQKFQFQFPLIKVENSPSNHKNSKAVQPNILKGDDLSSPCSIKDMQLSFEQNQQNQSAQEFYIQDSSQQSGSKISQLNLLNVSNNSSNDLRKRSTSSLFERRRVFSGQSHQSSDQEDGIRQKARSLRKITQINNNQKMEKAQGKDDYLSFLTYRPAFWEHFAINFLRNFLNFNQNQSEKLGNKLVLQNIGNSYSLIKIEGLKFQQIINDGKSNLFCEVSCPYFQFDCDMIKKKKNGHLFKNEPAIQDAQNKKLLISALYKSDLIDLVGSYNLLVPDQFKFKKFEKYKRSFNGFFSAGTNLQTVWTLFYVNINNEESNKCKNDQQKKKELYDKSIVKISKHLSENPSKVLGIDNVKGSIEVGKDADFIIWDPYSVKKFQVKDLYYQNSSDKHRSHIYNGKHLYGVVHNTIIRGHEVFKRQEQSLLFSKYFKPKLIVKENREI